MKKIRQRNQIRSLRNTIRNPDHFISKNGFIRWIVAFASLGLVYWIFSSSYFRVGIIECSSESDTPCDQNVMAELDKHKGELIFIVNIDSIKDKIKSADPIYSGVEVTPILPNSLVVTMKKKDSFANIQIASNSAALIVDQNHMVVDKLPMPTPGAISIISNSASLYSVGDKIDDEQTLSTLKLADELKKNYLSFKQIYFISSSQIQVTLQDDKLAVFTTTKDISRQVTSLQLILSKATISPEPLIIDMRFDMPVLKYKKGN